MSFLQGKLHNKHVLVTGATGFIGGRLAQRLATEESAIVTGTGRNLEKASWLKASGVNLVQADLMDIEKMGQLVQNQDVVFHVAAWMGRRGYDDQKAYTLNVTATESLIKQAAGAGVRRFVLVSSIAAYEFPTTRIIHEDTPLDTEQDVVYGRTKAIGEQRAWGLAKELGIEMAVVRPALVYGPRAESWTVNMVKMVQKGLPVIFGDGTGTAYPVFVDNLIDGMMLTAVHPAAANEAFNICDPAITLREFFTYYGEMCDRQPRSIPLWASNILIVINKLLRLKLPITRGRLRQSRLKVQYPTTKAEKMLGYQMRVPIPEGMKRTESWLREEGIIR